MYIQVDVRIGRRKGNKASLPSLFTINGRLRVTQSRQRLRVNAELHAEAKDERFPVHTQGDMNTRGKVAGVGAARHRERLSEGC